MPSKHYDLVNFTKKYKGELHSFFLDMKSWRKFRSRHKLNWTKLKFTDANHASVPKEPGLYAFVLELSPAKLPAHGYILYVGITGDDVSKSNLHVRYGQYLGHWRNEDGRPAVLYMMSNWANDLYFHFVPFKKLTVDLGKLERSLISAVIPPVNKRDLEAQIISAQAAAF